MSRVKSVFLLLDLWEILMSKEMSQKENERTVTVRKNSERRCSGIIQGSLQPREKLCTSALFIY